MPGQRPERRRGPVAATWDGASGRPLVELEELTRSLTELGLSQGEARLYVALLRLNDATAAQLARESGVPRPKVYEALGALETRGFCATIGDRVRRYRPVAPDRAIGDWLRHRDHERTQRSEHEQSLAETLVRLLPEPDERGSSRPPDFLEAVSGRARLTEALEDMIGRAERSVSMLMQPPWLQPRSRWNLAECAAVRRGVAVRVLYADVALRDPRRFRDLLDAGGECRTLPHVPMKLLVRDGVEALVSLRDTHTGEQSIMTVAMRHPDLAQPLGLLFEQEWKRARPIDGGGA